MRKADLRKASWKRQCCEDQWELVRVDCVCIKNAHGRAGKCLFTGRMCVSGEDLGGASRAGLGEKGCEPCEEM